MIQFEIPFEKEPKYLEDVSNWQNLFKLYELSRDWPALIEKYGEFTYDREWAENAVVQINKRYGEMSARYYPMRDFSSQHRLGYKLTIRRPTKDEFSAILDKEGKLLPSKNK